MTSTDSLSFALDLVADGEATDLIITNDGTRRGYRIAGNEQHDYTAFYDRIAADYGMRRPHHVEQAFAAPSGPRWQPLITTNLLPQILCGYGDPAVLKTDEGYYYEGYYYKHIGYWKDETKGAALLTYLNGGTTLKADFDGLHYGPIPIQQSGPQIKNYAYNWLKGCMERNGSTLKF